MPKCQKSKSYSTKYHRKYFTPRKVVAKRVRNSVANYSSVYVLTFKGIKPNRLKAICQEWKQSKLIFDNKTYMAEGLCSPTDKRQESSDDLCKLADFLKGKAALFFTNCEKSEITEWFDNYSFEDFADAGCEVDYSITLPKGPLLQVEPTFGACLKQLGLPITFKEGIVTLSCDYEVCKSGSVLKKDQAIILRIVGLKRTFRICLKAVWTEGVGLERLDENIDEDDDE